MVRRFTGEQILPVAGQLADEFLAEIVERMKELGLFAVTIPPGRRRDGLDRLARMTYAVVEEFSRGWISISGVLNPHPRLASARARARSSGW